MIVFSVTVTVAIAICMSGGRRANKGAVKNYIQEIYTKRWDTEENKPNKPNEMERLNHLTRV